MDQPPYLDQERMILILTVLSLLGHNPSPDQVQTAYEDSYRKYWKYLDRKERQQPLE